MNPNTDERREKNIDYALAKLRVYGELSDVGLRIVEAIVAGEWRCEMCILFEDCNADRLGFGQKGDSFVACESWGEREGDGE